MKVHNTHAEIYRPKASQEDVLGRLTHLAIGAHQDDIEIMAYHGIVACYRRPELSFGAVVVTDGAGCPRTGVYENYSNEDMCRIRLEEQKMAALVGDYDMLAALAYSSSEVKDTTNTEVVTALLEVLETTRPEVVYTHNLADKHETHVAVALRTLEALRVLPEDQRPKQVLGCEVWRGLDWLADEEKVSLDCSEHPNLHAALLGIFDSQISGGKRYDLGALGRCHANATFLESHGVDKTTSLTLAMDLTPLVYSETYEPEAYTLKYIEQFHASVKERIAKFTHR